MVWTSESGQDRHASRCQAVLIVASLCCACFALMNGCASNQHSHGDPLVGEHKGNPQGASPLAPAKTSSLNPPPPMVPSTSNAVLAANSLPGSRPLAIQEASWQRDQTPGAVSAVPVVPAKTGGGPVVQPVPREGQLVPVQMTGWSPSGPTADSPDALLQSRQVLNPQQEKVAEGIRVSGFVRDKVTPNRLHFVEATARDYLTAVQALVQQIDQWR